MMKILLVNTNPFDQNGMSTMVFNYAKGLLKQGHNVGVVANKVINSDFVTGIERLQGQVYLMKSRNKNPLKYILSLREICKENNYDTVYFHGNSGTLLVDLLSVVGLNRVVAVHAHGVETSYPKLDKILKVFMNKMSFTRMAVSKRAGCFLYGNKTFHITRNGIDVDLLKFDKSIQTEWRSKLGVSNDEKLLVQIGAFTDTKNHKFTIELAEKLQEHDYLNFKIVIVGDGPLKKQVQEDIKQRNLGNVVEIMAPTKNIACFMAAADGVLFPSLRESFGLIPLEAQAAGVPVAVNKDTTNMLDLTDLISYIDLSIPNWVEWVEKLEVKSIHESERYGNVIRKNGFDIETLVEDIVKTLEN